MTGTVLLVVTVVWLLGVLAGGIIGARYQAWWVGALACLTLGPVLGIAATVIGGRAGELV